MGVRGLDRSDRITTRRCVVLLYRAVPPPNESRTPPRGAVLALFVVVADIAGSARFLCRAPENFLELPDFTLRRRLLGFRTVLYLRGCDFIRAIPRCRAPASTCWLAAYCGWSDPNQSYGA